MSYCISLACKKFEQCKRACIYANFPNVSIEDFSYCGSSSCYIDKDGKQHFENEYWCGANGNYKMFIPITEESNK